MRLAGNTIATPDLSPFEAIELFASLGLDGVDFLCDAPEATSGVTVGLRQAARRELQKAITDSGLEPGCLRQYMRELHSLDATPRQVHIDGLKRHVDLAVDLGFEV